LAPGLLDFPELVIPFPSSFSFSAFSPPLLSETNAAMDRYIAAWRAVFPGALSPPL